ncbi:MAG: hypothetical protein EXR28_02355 [Betaproteobacteria bacterium]|nr:hypothetical protein [Betaproteobacteria bacterium]
MGPGNDQGANTLDIGGLLFQFFQNERLEGVEKSFKMADKTLLSNRFLMGVPKGSVAPDKLLGLCEKMAMPEKYLTALTQGLTEADTFHFGFEEGERGFICKVYLEYANRFYRAILEPSPESGTLLLHLAYKWHSLNRNEHTIARYNCHPKLSMDAALKKIGDIYSRHRSDACFEIVKDIMCLASSRTGEALMYLEVTEENNPRLSFDINLHAANLRLGDVGDKLVELCRHYSIAEEPFRRAVDPYRGQTLGHLSGGISRGGGDFLTVYHEVGGA